MIGNDIRHGRRQSPLAVAAVATLIGVSACSPFVRPSSYVYPLQMESLPNEWSSRISELNALEDGIRVRGPGVAKFGLSEKDRIETNDLALEYYRHYESPYYRSSGQSASAVRSYFGLPSAQSSRASHLLPKVCVALSGGGMRSAAFSIGILQGIQEHLVGGIGAVDILSSVSGGSYANAWLLGQRMLANDPYTLDRLLARDSASIEYLAHNANAFANPYLQAVVLPLNYAWQPLLALGSILPGITQVDIAGIGYYVDLNLFLEAKGRTKLQRIPIRDISGTLQRMGHPFPIFAATLQDREHGVCKKGQSRLSQVFEITPLRFGNPNEGYGDAFRNDAHMELTGVVMASGAALDGPAQFGCQLKRFLGLQSGVSYKGMSLSANVSNEDESSMESRGRSIDAHLIDGGFSENLALLPLIMRMCETTIVVDSDHDPDLEFKSYNDLRSSLKSEYGILLSVPEIDERAKKCFSRDGGNPASHFQCPVMIGSVSPIETSSGEIESKIVYIKLATEVDDTSWASEDVRVFIEKSNRRERCHGKALWRRCPFPQQSTSHQSFSTVEFMSYVELGRHQIESARKAQ